ncbi:hypothetical protein [Mucilaginibacter sp.]
MDKPKIDYTNNCLVLQVNGIDKKVDRNIVEPVGLLGKFVVNEAANGTI